MALCVNCGVELDEGLKICPLCGKDPSDLTGQEPVPDCYRKSVVFPCRASCYNYFCYCDRYHHFSIQ